MVTTAEGDALICATCWDHSDVGPDVPLTYEEQEGIEDA
jgi:hypothetical protein